MATLNFPVTSTIGTIYSYGTQSWTWDGRAWRISTLSALPTLATGYTGSAGITTTTTTAAVTNIVGTVSTYTAIPGYANLDYTGAINDAYTTDSGDLYVWKGATVVEQRPQLNTW